ncbi:hypothetical protein BV22DRAFT_1098583 [Leucogyrophana mollusca]|uniref:Uncharacterized protein n=1 Tax=Leucogyrophana mollusca TaxID=85980 RepID=A0ACB8B5Q3_9AGAM|nr:hypothetical protein BV22DRAFT_1098583 [Leucogyrophana mollusca]
MSDPERKATTSSLSSSSPVKRTVDSSIRHSATRSGTTRSRQDDEDDVRETWIEPMPVVDFLAEFMQCETLEPLPEDGVDDVFSEMWASEEPLTENMLLEKFVDIINAEERFPGFKLVFTGSNPDKKARTKLRPDVCVYPTDHDVEENRTDFLKMEMFMEFKKSPGADLFRDPTGKSESQKTYESFVVTGHGEHAKKQRRGQIVGYAAEACAKQHRVHLFSIEITGPFARLFLWDRSATVVTARFNYCDQPRLLLDFFRRFSRMSPRARGRDTTVEEATEEDEKVIRAAFEREGFQDRLCSGHPTMKLTVHDESSKTVHAFIVGKPEVEPSSLVGRATKAYIAVDLRTTNVVFLKDSWRVSAAGMVKEGDTLRKLNETGVRNVPQLLCAGDVDGENAQQTQSYTLIDKTWRCGSKAITPHTHYRQVVDVVARSIYTFTSSKQLVQVIHDAFHAHRDAVEKCCILHRDVSAGNILITKDGRGLLNDWDMSKNMDSQEARQLGRTGTWLFMSARILQNPKKIHEVQDDIESFVHVLLYVALCYTAHTITAPHVGLGDIIARLFHQATQLQDGTYTGGDGKYIGFMQKLVPTQVVFECTPIQQLVSRLVSFVQEWLKYCEALEQDQAQSPSDDGIPVFSLKPTTRQTLDDIILKDHELTDQLFASVLALPEVKWPQTETIQLHESAIPKRRKTGITTNPASRAPSSKRSLDLSESESTASRKRRTRARGSSLSYHSHMDNIDEGHH